MQHATQLNLIDFGHCAQFAGHQRIDFDVVFALQAVEMRHLAGALAVADEELAVFAQRALMDAEDAKFANEGVADHFEDMRQHMLFGVRLGKKTFGR